MSPSRVELNRFSGTQFGSWAQFLRWKISSALWRMREDGNWWDSNSFELVEQTNPTSKNLSLYQLNAGDGYYGGVLRHSPSCGRPTWAGEKMRTQPQLFNKKFLILFFLNCLKFSFSFQQIIHGDFNEQNILCRKKPNSEEHEVRMIYYIFTIWQSSIFPQYFHQIHSVLRLIFTF